MENSPIIVGISGASGAVYGVRLLQYLRKLEQKTILVISEMAFVTIKEELNLTPKEVIALADIYYTNNNLGASISSGSFLTKGMIIAPCSVTTLSNIANSNNSNLIARAADVCLKEQRKVVLLFRETPLHRGHIRLMAEACENGAIVMPPLPAFYNKPQTIDDMIDHNIARVLDLFNIANDFSKRWK